MNHDHSSHSDSNRHLLLMLLCCLIPLALILSISVFGLSLGALTPYLPFALVLLCPLLMVFMMRGMMDDHKAADTPTNLPTRQVSTRIGGENDIPVK